MLSVGTFTCPMVEYLCLLLDLRSGRRHHIYVFSRKVPYVCLSVFSYVLLDYYYHSEDHPVSKRYY